MKQVFVIAIVSLALGVTLGLAVPALSVEPEATGLSEVVDPSEAVDRAEPFAPDADGAGGGGACLRRTDGASCDGTGRITRSR